jgi:NAD(P)-dependent dehydrogenase (short-subunit alcohol dehydrogenase family)
VTDRVCVVTGAASGLGAGIARRLGAAGARLVLADVDEHRLRHLASDMEGAGVTCAAMPTDVRDSEAVDALAQHVLERFGAIHVVCNNAGVIATGPAWEITPDDWRRVVDVNLLGVAHGVHAFVPRMLAGGEPGHVVNTASMAGVISMAGLAPYSATKHAVVALSETLHLDLAETGAPIGVSVLCPGYVPTRLGLPADGEVSEPSPGEPGADDVGQAVVDAIVADEFFVFTHDGWRKPVQRRVDAVLAGEAPPLRPRRV